MAQPFPGRRLDSPELRARFLAGLRVSLTVRAAAAAAGVGRFAVYRWRKGDPGFAAAWDEAYALGTDRLQLELRRRALGPCQPVEYRGRNPKHRRRQTDEMLIRLHALYEAAAAAVEAGVVDDGRLGAEIPPAPARVRTRKILPPLRRRSAAEIEEEAAMQRRFLADLRCGLPVVRAAAALGVRPLVCNRWRWRDPQFAARWEEAYAAGGAALLAARRKLTAARQIPPGLTPPGPAPRGLTPVTQWSDAQLMYQLERRRAGWKPGAGAARSAASGLLYLFLRRVDEVARGGFSDGDKR